MIRFCLLFLGLLLSLRGAPSLRLTAVALSNGKQYPELEIRSYDPTSGRVVALAQGAAFTVAFNQLSNTDQAAVALHFKNHPTPQSSVSIRAPIAPRTRSIDSEPARSAVPTPPPVDPIRLAAEKRMRTYFQSEYRPDTNGDIKLENRLDILAPEPVPGWTGCYRVTCVAYTSNRAHPEREHERSEHRYEVYIETKDNEPVGTDVTVK